jgi:hypothetical protein
MCRETWIRRYSKDSIVFAPEKKKYRKESMTAVTDVACFAILTKLFLSIGKLIASPSAG